MTPSAECIEIIKKFEGCELRAYRDPKGVLTIGYGHTHGVFEGQEITPEEAERLLAEDVTHHAAIVISNTAHMTLTQNEFDALTCFVFNVGNKPFDPAKSPNTLAAFRSGDRQRIADALLWWKYQGGMFLPGLLRRRRAERALFLGQEWRGF